MFGKIVKLIRKASKIYDLIDDIYGIVKELNDEFSDDPRIGKLYSNLKKIKDLLK